MDQATESIVVADGMGRIVYLNLAAERQVGRPRSELVGRHFVVALAAGQEGGRHDEISRVVGAGQTWAGRYVASTANGITVAVDLVVTPVRDAGGRIANFVAIGRDVSREWSLEGDLAREVRLHAGIVSTLARLDSAETVEDQAQHLADALMNLDGVHLARVVAFGPGDLWYRVAARGHDEIAVSGSRPTAAFVRSIRHRARNGAWVDTAQRWAAMSRVRTALEAAGISVLAFAPIRHRGVLVGLLVAATTDVGASALRGHLSAITELADVGSAMLGSSFAARQQAADVRSAVDRIIAEGAFRPVYQPIVRLRDGLVLGYEALTRFDDGRAPDVRFAEAAAVGLGFDLEVATLKAALEGARVLPPDAVISVNVSPAIVAERQRLESTLRETSIDRSIVLEITEREPVDDYAALRDAISLMAVPVRWAIDDAGAGFASLRHIIELRPQYVKLDRALIADIALDPARQALVAGLLHFSEALGTTLIAEGIETDAERLALEQLGLTVGQGYLFGRPQEVGDLAETRESDWPAGPDGSAEPTPRSME